MTSDRQLVVRVQAVWGPTHPGFPYWKVALDVPGDTLLSTCEYPQQVDAERRARQIQELIDQ